MKPIASQFILVIPLIAACAHSPVAPPEPRMLSAAPFTETTTAAPGRVSDAVGFRVPTGPYSELAHAVSDVTLNRQVITLLKKLARDGSNPELRVELGAQLLEGGRPDLALAPLRDAFYLRPGRAGIAALLTRAYVGAGQFPAALELAQRLVNERPDESGRWLFLAEVRRLAGQQQQALNAASRALLINPSAHEAKALLGFIYAERGQTSLARKLLTAVLEKPGVEVAALEHRLGRLEMTDENWQAALEHLNECLRLAPKMAAALNDRGVVAARLGRWAEANRDFAAAVTFAPQLAEAQVNLANMKIEAGLRAEAHTALEAARQVGTEPGAFFIAAGRLYALDASTATGRANALRTLQRAKAHVPEETRIALDRAVAKIQSLPPPIALPAKPSKPLPAPASPVRKGPDESPTEPEQTEMFRPSVE